MPGEKPVVVYEGSYLRLLKAGRQEFVARKNITGVVTVLALTADGKIVLVEQFRKALERRVVSLPAGLAGDNEDKSEDLLVAAKRELREEAGYASTEWKYLMAGPTSSGLTSETITFFLAANAVQDDEAELDAEEGIEVHVVPLAELRDFLGRKEESGRAIDYKIFAALYLASPLSSLEVGRHGVPSLP